MRLFYCWWHIPHDSLTNFWKVSHKAKRWSGDILPWVIYPQRVCLIDTQDPKKNNAKYKVPFFILHFETQM